MMKTHKNLAAAVLCILALAPAGCATWGGDRKTPTAPLGAQSDAIWRRQEAGGAASDFVIYQHEFEMDGARLNLGGEDHLRSIAARLHCGAPVPVVVERSMTSVRPDSEYRYPVNANPDLDMKRRAAVVKSLIAMGLPQADHCVVVAPAMAEGYTATEAVQAYYQGLTGATNGRGAIGAPVAGGLNNIGMAGSYGIGGSIP
jgi:hypothetical protein